MFSPVTVVMGGDEAFATGLAAVGRSVVRHRPAARPLRFYIVDAGLTDRTRDMLAASLSAEGTEVNWLRLDAALLDRCGITVDASRRAGSTTLVLDALLPEHVERLLFLDADTLVLSDLTPLWDADMDGRVLAAVRDTMIPTLRSDSYWPEELEPSIHAPYFNAGVMLIDFVGWRREQIGPTARAFRARHGHRLWGFDQQVLNWTLAGRWTPLPLAWNRMTHVRDIPSHVCTRVEREEFEEAVARPRIVHFAGRPKPWQPGCRDDQASAFAREMQDTAWAPWHPPAPAFATALADSLWREPHRRFQFVRRGLRLARREGLPSAPWYRAAAGVAMRRPWSAASFAALTLARRLRRMT